MISIDMVHVQFPPKIRQRILQDRLLQCAFYIASHGWLEHETHASSLRVSNTRTLHFSLLGGPNFFGYPHNFLKALRSCGNVCSNVALIQ